MRGLRTFLLLSLLASSGVAFAREGVLAEPSASFVHKDAAGVETRLELRCVSGNTANEPYYCEIARSLNGVEMSAHAIYPKQLQSIWARYWMEKGDAAGSFLSLASPVELSWEWRFSDRFMKGRQNFPSRSVTSSESRAAIWLFKTLQAWSNFGS